MNTNEPKPGILTSEFYLTIANSVAGFAVMLGYLSPQQADEFIQAVVAVLGGLMIIISTIVYVYGRYKLKSSGKDLGTQGENLPIKDAIRGLNQYI